MTQRGKTRVMLEQDGSSKRPRRMPRLPERFAENEELNSHAIKRLLLTEEGRESKSDSVKEPQVLNIKKNGAHCY